MPKPSIDGLQLRANYTWSKNLGMCCGDLSDVIGGSQVEQFCIDAGRFFPG